MAGVDINALIDCYHKLIEKEREILESSGWRFDASTRLDSGTVYNICGSWTMVSELLRRKLLIEYPDGTFRTMHFDLIYRLVNVRVTMGGAPVPLEFRVVLKKEELPDFNEKSFDELSYELPGELLEALRLCGIKSLSRFQFEYIDAMMRDLIGSSDNYDAYVISSPTASGKTLIFFIPALILALKGQRSIFMYPRKALATDQLRFFLKVISRLNEILGDDVITIGIEDGDTEWERYLGKKVGKDFRSLKCPECDDGILVYDRDRTGKYFVKCNNCGKEFRFILVARDYIWENPPSILITNIYTINLRLMNKDAQRFFSTEKGSVALVVMDEAHLYKEELGGHVHYILRRLFSTLREIFKEPKIVLCSATLPRPVDFASRLTGIQEHRIFWLNYEDYVRGARRTKLVLHLFLLPNPFRSSETLAEEVIHALAVWAYATGKKVIFFVDSVPEVKRLYHFVKDKIILERKAPIEHIEQVRDIEDPYCWGHYFDSIPSNSNQLVQEIAEIMDHHYGDMDMERRHKIEEMLKTGEKRLIISTSTMELGIDIGDVSIIGQYRVPFTSESYQQRVGRAGRSEDSYRTALAVLVLSNSPSQVRYLYGEEWQDLIELPEEFRIPIAIDNSIIKRIHMFNAVLDVLARHGYTTHIYGKETRHWRDPLIVIGDLIQLIDYAKNLLSALMDYVAHVVRDPPEPLNEFLDHIKRQLSCAGTALNQIGALSGVPRDDILWVKAEIEKLADMASNVKLIFTIFETLGINIPEDEKSLLEKLTQVIVDIYGLFENMSKFVRDGDINSLMATVQRIRGYNIGVSDRDLEDVFVRILMVINEHFSNIMRIKNRKISIEEFRRLEGIRSYLVGILDDLLSFFRDDFPKLIGQGLDAYLLLPYEDLFVMIDKRRRQREFFGILDAMKALGIIPQMTITLGKPLPTVHMYYPDIDRSVEKSIDRALYLCTPLRIDIQDRKFQNRWYRVYYTTMFPLRFGNYSVKRLTRRQIIEESYEPFDGYQDRFRLGDVTIVTPLTINMIPISRNLLDIYVKGRYSRLKVDLFDRTPYYDLWNCSYCRWGLMVTSRQNLNVCRFNDCLLRQECGGTRYFCGPPFTSSYFKLFKVYPIIRREVSEPAVPPRVHEILENLLKIFTFKGSIFRVGVVGCTMLTSGSEMTHSPTFWFRKGMGYRINTRGLLLAFNRRILLELVEDALTDDAVYRWIVLKYLMSKKYFRPLGDLNLRLAETFMASLMTGRAIRGAINTVREFERLIERKRIKPEVWEEILRFALEVFLHTFSHLIYEILVDKLQTSNDNLTIYYTDDEDRNFALIYIIENAEDGIGLTETIDSFINVLGAKNFMIELLWRAIQIARGCEVAGSRYRLSAINALNESLRKVDKSTADAIREIMQDLKDWLDTMESKYGVYPPIDLVRYVLISYHPRSNELLTDEQKRSLLNELIVSVVPYCWDGCYLCVRLERGCNLDPYRQMVLVSRSLLLKICEKLLSMLNSRVSVGTGFEDVLDEIKSAQSELRISSPWLSQSVLEKFLEELLERGVRVKMLTKFPEVGEKYHREALEYINCLRERFPDLLEVKLLDNLHAKLVIVDDKLLVTGSMNLTESGIHRNIEVVLRVREKDAINEAIEQFERLWTMPVMTFKVLNID